MTPNNQSVSGDAQNFGRPRQPMVHRPGPCWHGPNCSWPREIPDQRGRGTVGHGHGQIRPCKSLRDRTNGPPGTHLARPRGGVRSRACVGGNGPSIPSTTARGMAETAPGLWKSPTSEAMARPGPATAKSARAKVYAIGPMDLWATIKLGHGSAYAAKQA